MTNQRTHKNLPAEYLSGIGAVTVAWSHLESNLGNVVMNLGAIHAPVSLAITIEMGSQPLLNVIQITVNTQCSNEELLIRWNRLISDIQEIRGERNRVVHGQWTWGFEYPDKYFVSVHDYSAKGTQITGSSLQRSPESLKEIAARIYEMIDQMQQLVLETIPQLAHQLASAPRVIQVVQVAQDARMRKERGTNK